MRDKTDLESWFAAQPESAFPRHGGASYFERYWAVARYLEDEVHPTVNLGAMVKDGGFLTNHGPEHITTIQLRAQDLVPPEKLAPYELYLLLMAAQFHDVGNLFGREDHQHRVPEVMKHLRGLLGEDAVEMRAISNIAEAHTGRTPGEDTVALLPKNEVILEFEVRFQAVAALLRLADELADDRTRASRFALNAGVVPERSELYHQYAKHLHSVRAYADTGAIDLRFDINADIAEKTFLRDGGRTYLLEEIFRRTLKLHLERAYCMRYLAPIALFDEVKVSIRLFESDHHPRPFEEIGYRLRERGYPQLPVKSIHQLCPEIGGWTGSKLRRRIRQLRRE